MAGGTSAEQAQMDTFNKNATDAAGQIQSAMTSMLNNLGGLPEMRGAWATAFSSLQSLVGEQTKDCVGSLNGIAADIGSISSQYTQADSDMQAKLKPVMSTFAATKLGH